MNYTDKIYVSGHRGMVGSAIIRELEKKGYKNIVKKTSEELDLRNQIDVEKFFKKEKPDIVILAAAKAGGIGASSTDNFGFLMDNLQIEINVISAAYKNNVKKFLFLGSSCIYPKTALQPFKEDCLLTGPLEPTCEGYALGKIAGLKACEYLNKEKGLEYISVMPTNLYGINDNLDVENSHVIPAIMQRMHDAKINKKPYIKIWGTGQPHREFLYVDDMAKATIFLLENYSGDEIVNIGYGTDISIKELTETIKKVVGYKGEIKFDTSKPDGMYKKLVDIKKIEDLGWKPETTLKEGLEEMYDWYLTQI